MPRGRRPLPWIKLWFDILGDPKMKRLTIAERGCWDGILLLAGQSPVRGKLLLTDIQPMTIRDISKALNLTNREVSYLKSCISKMTELGSLRWDSEDCLEVINFQKRQGPPQYIGETEASLTQREKPVKQLLIQRLWANEWQPTGEKIVSVESEKRIGNLYIDILAKTQTGGLILIEVKPFSLYVSHLGQVSRYISAVKTQNSTKVLQVFAILIGKDRRNITDEDAKLAGVSLLTFKELPFNVVSTVISPVDTTLNQPYIEVEGRGERKKRDEDISPLPSGKGALARPEETEKVRGGEPLPAINKHGRGGDTPAKKQPPAVLEIFAEMRSYLGYPEKVKEDPIPAYGREGQAIKRMLTRGFTRGEILACWRSKVSQRGGEFVSMTWVNEDIHKERPAQDPDKYIRGKYGHIVQR